VWSADLGYADTDAGVAGVARAAADRLADAGVITWVPTGVVLDDPEPAWRAHRAGAGTDPARAANDRRLAALFARVDVLLTPTTAGPPHGHDGPGDRMNVSLTWAFNVSGHPAASVPAGLDPEGLPVGLQCVAGHGREDVLVGVAAAVERLAPWPAPGEPAAGPSTRRGASDGG
jgi:Asp-tRNA(Asn)/Glu-tRNA(Gln) amidotransferase A subunit family amidase